MHFAKSQCRRKSHLRTELAAIQLDKMQRNCDAAQENRIRRKTTDIIEQTAKLWIYKIRNRAKFGSFRGAINAYAPTSTPDIGFRANKDLRFRKPSRHKYANNN